VPKPAAATTTLRRALDLLVFGKASGEQIIKDIRLQPSPHRNLPKDAGEGTRTRVARLDSAKAHVAVTIRVTARNEYLLDIILTLSRVFNSLPFNI